MGVYMILFIEALPFLALVAFGVRELILLDRLKTDREEGE
jgi:hypothetical protein